MRGSPRQIIQPPPAGSPFPADTSAEALRVHLDVLRRLGPAGRLRMAFELSDGLRSVLEAGVRQRHPDYDERTDRLAATRLAIGETLFRAAFPDVRVAP